QRMAHLDAERAQQVRRTYARQLKELRRVVTAAGQDHFLSPADLDLRAAAAALDVAHADRALAFKDDVGGVGMGPDMAVRAFARRMQERGRRADAQALLDRA